MIKKLPMKLISSVVSLIRSILLTLIFRVSIEIYLLCILVSLYFLLQVQALTCAKVSAKKGDIITLDFESSVGRGVKKTTCISSE